MKTFKEFTKEDFGGAVAANNVGQGNIAGVGVGPQGEPGGTAALLYKKKRPFRRSGPKLEDVSVKIFDVTPERFYDVRVKRHKYPMLNDYIGEDIIAESVKAFATQYPQASIILRNNNSRELFYIR